MPRRTLSFAASLIALLATPALAGPDTAAGQQIYQAQCSACHSNQPGVNGIGPSLAGLAGRKAGSLPGFHYTQALQGSGLTFDDKTFIQFLADPSKLVPGTAMTVTVADETGRANLFAYLATLKGDEAGAKQAPAAAVPKITGPTQGELDEAASATKNWLYASHDYAGSRFVHLDQITPDNAKTLHPVCLYRSEQPASVQTSPLVYDGVMYLTFGRATVAIDAKTCRERWSHVWQPKGKEISPANRGAAIKDGTLVRGTADGYLIALNMADGSLLWDKPIASFAGGQYLSMPPLIYGDLIIIGPSGADFGAKNWIGAFKLATGDPVWKFNLIPDPGEPGAETWENPDSLKHGGGSLWTPVSLDAKAGIVYLPAGNPAPDFYGEIRPGANLYTNSLVALDAKTGKLIWYRQFIPHDVHDADLSQVSPLFETTVGGKMRKVVSVSGKDGLLRLLDRDTHEQFYEVPITTRENVDALPTVEGVHRCPGLLGGMEWNGPAYDPATNTLFVPAVDWCGTFSKAPEDPPIMEGMHYYGGAVAQDPREKSKGWLTAVDASTGKERWKYASTTPMVAGVTATSGGVLFTGDLNNDFLALSAMTGEVLYRFNTGGSIGGGVITYALAGKQYVAAPSGTVSAFFGGSGLPAVVIFAAGGGGTAKLAAAPVDPDKAPVAAVDRFSAKAAHLQLRNPDNGLPGPNEPVDFDTGPFVTQGLAPASGKPVRYYNFDVQATQAAPVYVLTRDGEDAPVEGQLDIIDTLPGEQGYNDFRQVWKVTVPKNYAANTIVDAATLMDAGYRMEKTETLRNMPVVPDKSTARMRLNGESADLQRAWYQGQVAKFFAFNEAPLTGAGGNVPLSPIYVTFNVNPDQPNGGPPSGFRAETDSKQTHNVPATLPGDPGYSPLWLVSIYDNADFPNVHDLSTVTKAKVLAPGAATVNCPIVAVEP
jgi:PQQ-dependent dehydrogenase (methanol/ethanol family)